MITANDLPAHWRRRNDDRIGYGSLGYVGHNDEDGPTQFRFKTPTYLDGIICSAMDWEPLASAKVHEVPAYYQVQCPYCGTIQDYDPADRAREEEMNIPHTQFCENEGCEKLFIPRMGE